MADKIDVTIGNKQQTSVKKYIVYSFVAVIIICGILLILWAISLNIPEKDKPEEYFDSSITITTPAITTPAITTHVLTTPAITTPAITTPAMISDLKSNIITTVPEIVDPMITQNYNTIPPTQQQRLKYTPEIDLTTQPPEIKYDLADVTDQLSDIKSSIPAIILPDTIMPIITAIISEADTFIINGTDFVKTNLKKKFIFLN